MKNMKVLPVLWAIVLLMRSQQATASILVDYYRLPKTEREKVTQDQAKWDKFHTHLIKAHSEAVRDALDKLKLDGLSTEERLLKIAAAMEKVQNPAQFNLEKDWHVIAYLLTGDAKITEAHQPNAPLHNVIFGGLKASATTGYGPVRYFDTKLVAEIAAALANADQKILTARYDPAAMKKLDIYAPPEADEKKAILQSIEELTSFFQKAAAAHEEVIKFVH